MARFQKGQSGNPSGRAKRPKDIEDLFKSYSEGAASTLYKIAMNPKENARARVMAANSILDRGWGKPVQRVAGKDGAPIVVRVLTLAEADWEDEQAAGDAG